MAAPALTDTEVLEVYQLFGIPKGGAAFVDGLTISLFGPAGESYDCSMIVTQLQTKLTALDGTQITMLQSLLTSVWTITPHSPIEMVRTSTAAGTIVDHPRQIQMLRDEISNLIGFMAPRGGFSREVAKGAAEGGMTSPWMWPGGGGGGGGSIVR